MDWQSGKIRARLCVTHLPGPAGPEALLEQLSQRQGPILLESSASHESFGRYSIAACDPLAVLEVREGKLYDEDGCCLASNADAFWAMLDRAFQCVTLHDEPAARAQPYMPGWIGYIGYEIGRFVETLPGRARRDTALPDLRLAFYEAVAVFDSIEGTWMLAELDFAGKGNAGQTLRKILAAGSEAQYTSEPAPSHLDSPPAELFEKLPKSNFSPEDYRQAVARCVEYIAAGDIFQVNLSQRFEINPAPAPRAIYRALRQRNPACYSAWLEFDSAGQHCAVLSSSPELFLRCRNRRVITRPIKGTRPRIGEPSADQAAARELLASEKDNAELAMIIDLLRNDLGRVCKFGSVRVTDPLRLETHPTVFHLVGTVEGELLPGASQADLLRATFPGGSITGAPKIRAMEIIDELEPVARGVYTGCIGIVGVDGSAEWNIVIRTIVCHGQEALVQVGGGIVADSTPEGEYRETLDKARAMLEALVHAETARKFLELDSQ